MKRADDLARKEAAKRALSAFFKLRNSWETAENLKRQIDEMFREAASDGRADWEPWAKVKEIVGSDYQEPVIETEETAFLIEAKQAELLDEIHLVQRRIWNIIASAKRYDELRAELVKLVEKHHAEAVLSEGNVMEAVISGREGIIAAGWELRLQNLLGQVMEMLEVDTVRAWEALTSFKEAAEKHFGNEFPKFGFERAIT